MKQLKGITGYEDMREFYWASEDGKIISTYHDTGELKLTKALGGYHQVKLTTSNGRKFFLVDKIIATAFIDNPSGTTKIKHKNGDNTDNRVDNLEWIHD